MTVITNHKEYAQDGKRYFVEQYADKPHFVPLWRYGEYLSGCAYVIKSQLRSRPNIKRVFNL